MDQKTALDILKLGRNVYLTGAAGSGKTYLLNQYIKYLKDKGAEVGVTASTGIAATHMNGVTIHSWSGLGIKDHLSAKDLRELLKKRHLVKRFGVTKVLIIDEISMLHSFQLDLVDRICREFKGVDLPFGGIQVVMCGDFFQLPPVSHGLDKSQFVNHSEIWHNMDLEICYLDEQHRQEDPELLEILSNMRANECGDKDLSLLKARCGQSSDNSSGTTKLYTHNVDVDGINNRELQAIAGTTNLYTMRNRGKSVLADTLKKGCLAPEKLYLKKGAKVMFVKNNFEQSYVNGTLGEVVDFDEEGFPIVQTISGRQIVAAPMSWVMEDEGSVKAEIVQIPLRLAWAITVHKSQGMSLDAAEIDLSKSFERGMGYVALSRVRTLAGIKLMGINEMALRVDDDVIAFNQELIRLSESAKFNISSLGPEEIIKKQKLYLDSIAPAVGERKMKKPKKVSGATYLETKGLLAKKLSVTEIANRRGMTDSTIISHLEKLLARGDKLDLEHLKPEQERFIKIAEAFNECEDMSLAPVRELLGESFSYKEIRLARLFLNLS